ncbi:MAG: hypothetical protein KDA93_11095 [Planctomycetaceae bacterium]|nr:hypothetical protein [Planctomycetaceae bacterium]
MFGILRRLFGNGGDRQRLQPEASFVVTCDEESVVCQRPNGDKKQVRWDDLRAVLIETNDTGPWGTDVYWLLVGRDAQSGCVVPQGATGEEALLTQLQQLPGFDNEALIEAMGSTENQKFLCWEAADYSGGRISVASTAADRA